MTGKYFIILFSVWGHVSVFPRGENQGTSNVAIQDLPLRYVSIFKII